MPDRAFFDKVYLENFDIGLKTMAVSFFMSLENNAIKHIISEQEQYFKSFDINISHDERSDIILKETEKGLILCHSGKIVQSFNKPIKIGEIIDGFLRLKKTLLNEAAKSKALYIQNIVFSPFDMTLGMPSDMQIRLTEKERDFLLALYEAEGKTLSRSQLLQKVWEYADTVETHTLETHVYRLRQKLENIGFGKEPLVTTENGYKLVTKI